MITLNHDYRGVELQYFTKDNDRPWRGWRAYWRDNKKKKAYYGVGATQEDALEDLYRIIKKVEKNRSEVDKFLDEITNEKTKNN